MLWMQKYILIKRISLFSFAPFIWWLKYGIGILLDFIKILVPFILYNPVVNFAYLSEEIQNIICRCMIFSYFGVSLRYITIMNMYLTILLQVMFLNLT